MLAPRRSEGAQGSSISLSIGSWAWSGARLVIVSVDCLVLCTVKLKWQSRFCCNKGFNYSDFLTEFVFEFLVVFYQLAIICFKPRYV